MYKVCRSNTNHNMKAWIKIKIDTRPLVNNAKDGLIVTNLYK